MIQTFGEKIVRKNPSPTEKADVKEAKRLCAELLDFCEGFVPEGKNAVEIEEQRLLAHAATCFEEGCMWLVKALTVPKE